jgi:hypothetical protein
MWLSHLLLREELGNVIKAVEKFTPGVFIKVPSGLWKMGNVALSTLPRDVLGTYCNQGCRIVHTWGVYHRKSNSICLMSGLFPILDSDAYQEEFLGLSKCPEKQSGLYIDGLALHSKACRWKKLRRPLRVRREETDAQDRL